MASLECDAARVEVGDHFSRISHGKVTGVSADGAMFDVVNCAGYEWRVGREVLEREFQFPVQVQATEEVTRTELAKRLATAADSTFVVEFRKQPTEKHATELLREPDVVTSAKRRRLAKEILAGVPRRLVGHLVSHDAQDADGRFQVIDQEVAPGAHALRLVDPRTLESLQLRGVRSVKK